VDRSGDARSATQKKKGFFVVSTDGQGMDPTKDITDLAVFDRLVQLDHDETQALILMAARPSHKNPVSVYLGRLAAGSRRAMSAALDNIADTLTGGQCDMSTLDWTQIRYQHAAAVRAALAEKYAPATVNKFLSALRGVMKECWRLGYITAEDYQRAADQPAVRGTSLAPGRALSMGELATLFEGCAADKRPIGARDAALLAVLYGAGLRRAEVVGLNVSDYNRETAELRIRRGKGRKARICWAPAGCVLALDRWLQIRGDEAGPLFCPINKSGKMTVRRLVPQTVLDVLVSRARKHRVSPFSPHDLRRTFIGDLLDRGADISTVQQLAGHANVQTTARYDRRADTVRRKAVELLHVPFRADL
jgi:site-specific recombinase XerD